MGRAACLFLLSIDAYVNSHRPHLIPKQLANHTECNQNQAHAICAESAVLYRSSKTSTGIYVENEAEALGLFTSLHLNFNTASKEYPTVSHFNFV